MSCFTDICSIGSNRKGGAKRDDRYAELNRLQAREDEMHPRDFDGFRDRHLTFTRETYRISDLCARPPEADCYICGSDQIWAYPDAGYMLDFGPRGVRRIAYAASMGGNDLADRIQRSRFARRLKRLDIVSLREKDGVEVCREAGRKDAFLGARSRIPAACRGVSEHCETRERRRGVRFGLSAGK